MITCPNKKKMKTIIVVILIISLNTFYYCNGKTNIKSTNNISVKINDYWVYEHRIFGITGNIKSTFMDTVIIQLDTLINGKHFFNNNKNELIKVVDNRIETYDLINSIDKPLFPECVNKNYSQKIELIGQELNGYTDTTRFNLTINCLSAKENYSINGFLLDCSFYSSSRTKSINKPRRSFSKRDIYYNHLIGKVKEVFWSDNKIEYEIILIESSLLD